MYRHWNIIVSRSACEVNTDKLFALKLLLSNKLFPIWTTFSNVLFKCIMLICFLLTCIDMSPPRHLNIHKHEIILIFFLPKSKLYMPLVNFSKKISIIVLRFSPEFRCSNIFAVAEHTRNQFFFGELPKYFCPQNFHFGPIIWVLCREGFLFLPCNN